MKNPLDELNEKQKEAVTTTNGPLLIIAGAGSGKTKTLTHRIAHLIRSGISPGSILAITFTNKAAEEMRNRIALLARRFDYQNDKNDQLVQIDQARRGGQSNSSASPFIGTFHSFCNRVLREDAQKIGFTASFTIFDEDDSLSLIKEIQKDLNMNPKQFPAGVIANTISRLKSECTNDLTYKEIAGEEFFPKKVSLVFTEYQRRLKNSNAMDFDDLIAHTVTLFEKHPAVLGKYQDRYRYINVDEYQDTNIAQYRFIELLAKKYGNIAVVGDDAQSIYSFRHADYRNILQFERMWPTTKLVVLDENYRSTQTILDAASDIIAKNTLQKKKRLWTQKQGGDPLTIVHITTERLEADYIIQEIQKLQETLGLRLRDIAVLYRTNAQSRVIEEAFLREEVPYTIIGGIKFYARKEIKDLIAYFRYALNEKDALSLKRIINVPPRKIGKQTLLKFLMNSKLRDAEESHLDSFQKCITWLREMIAKESPSKALRALVKKIRYEEYLLDQSRDPDVRVENIKEFEGLAKRYDTLEKPDGLMKMLEDIALFSETDTAANSSSGSGQGKDCVQMMTLHAAKGLEFPVVFMAGLEEGLLPHARSLMEPPMLEEERRLCYVGLTRAKIKAYMLYTSRRTIFGQTQMNVPSRFLSEISPEFVERIGRADDTEDDIIEDF